MVFIIYIYNYIMRRALTSHSTNIGSTWPSCHSRLADLTG